LAAETLLEVAWFYEEVDGRDETPKRSLRLVAKINRGVEKRSERFRDLSTLMEEPMRKKRRLETERQRRKRLEKDAQDRINKAKAADKAIELMVTKSVKLHGP
jgi:hypothetical protein